MLLIGDLYNMAADTATTESVVGDAVKEGAVLQQEHSGCGELAGRNRGCTEEPDRDHHEYDQTVHQGI